MKFPFSNFSDHKGYTIVLHIEVFGYEALLYELARSNIKIELTDCHKYWFGQAGFADVFDYEGEPHIKLSLRFQAKDVFSARQYKRFVIQNSTVFLRFIAIYFSSFKICVFYFIE